MLWDKPYLCANLIRTGYVAPVKLILKSQVVNKAGSGEVLLVAVGSVATSGDAVFDPESTCVILLRQIGQR